MEGLAYLLLPFQQPLLIALVAIGVFAGIYIGAIPGLSGTMAVSLLVSFTFGWETNNAIALMIGVFSGAVYGGSRSAILLNIPGAPAAVATSFDGYPLAKKGLAGQAIGVATVQSVLGGFMGIIALAFFAPAVSKVALNFAPRDYLLLTFMGMMLVGSLGSKSIARGLVTAALGVLLGTVGMDPISAEHRFTFGNTYLLSGVDYVTAMIGLFGISEALIQMKDLNVEAVKQNIDKIVPSFSSIKKYLPLTLRSSIVGVIVGALPGAGGDIAALLTYDQAKRTVKNPEVPFGEGAIEGVVAPESANNAAIGGSFIPMLTMGIPGDSVTAVILGALFIHGLHPGPMLMVETPHLFYLIVSTLAISNIFLLIFGLSGIRVFTKLVEIPKGRLLPIIIILSVVGSYAVNNNLYDIFWMVGFGILGYFLKQYDYPVGPAVLGIILADLIETNYRRSVITSGSIIKLFSSIFTSPLSMLLLAIIIFSLLAQTKWYKEWQAKRK
ncbi:tripartite tricarboxylate transporter permease [Tissierella sp. Yu-01]|uniref:tripartite tricarboxylate transporter permease n=1 Tax=Tissierella sp. Yu-01 TaxID=3035694 RepID=UPI00240E80A4|nr:tripartite tricarboxylate transporter permease [Tissierella sp. Yu-01]WFA07873.1 tripartite tricarboxylate transporter permease [Tissierella sp. Yu-01]